VAKPEGRVGSSLSVDIREWYSTLREELHAQRMKIESLDIINCKRLIRIFCFANSTVRFLDTQCVSGNRAGPSQTAVYCGYVYYIDISRIPRPEKVAVLVEIQLQFSTTFHQYGQLVLLRWNVLVECLVKVTEFLICSAPIH